MLAIGGINREDGAHLKYETSSEEYSYSKLLLNGQEESFHSTAELGNIASNSSNTLPEIGHLSQLKVSSLLRNLSYNFCEETSLSQDNISEDRSNSSNDSGQSMIKKYLYPQFITIPSPSVTQFNKFVLNQNEYDPTYHDDDKTVSDIFTEEVFSKQLPSTRLVECKKENTVTTGNLSESDGDTFSINETNLYPQEITNENQEYKKIFICGTCGQNFDDYILLKEHDEIHSQCIPSSVVVTQESDLNELHSRNKELRRRGRKKCSECDQTFLTSSGLNYHMTLVHYERSTNTETETETQTDSIQYPICNWGFHNESSLTEHIIKHFDEQSQNIKSIKCNVCNKMFECDSDLQKHILQLHNDKKYDCDLCSKTFPDSYNLRRHKLSKHTEISCVICGKKFIDKWKFRWHGLRESNCRPSNS